jgi:hypothetical protein
MCLKLLAGSQIELSYICVDVDTLEFKRPRASRAVPARNDPLISSSAPDGHNASHPPIIRRLVAPKIPWFRAIFSEIDIRDGPAQKPPRLRVRKCLTLHGCKVLCSTAQNQMFLGGASGLTAGAQIRNRFPSLGVAGGLQRQSGNKSDP